LEDFLLAAAFPVAGFALPFSFTVLAMCFGSASSSGVSDFSKV
jgi:hypothetical protein